ncbi:hypothetical protein HYPSUDRAFT_201542 [Hypholoma sublateritium FD-334 SS-4]|uniref:Uncharacterized protein n=1 Tax=Hypholoma sublateritium (strain FD-334 SS-4) TaxID=945553 RepID=A0A0D2P3L1_HYPSF|nr:hypothetical protein HYPSUDRAFT_201542 [Hypholoma sublateritium FD-334 SS-4]
MVSTPPSVLAVLLSITNGTHRPLPDAIVAPRRLASAPDDQDVSCAPIDTAAPPNPFLSRLGPTTARSGLLMTPSSLFAVQYRLPTAMRKLTRHLIAVLCATLISLMPAAPPSGSLYTDKHKRKATVNLDRKPPRRPVDTHRGTRGGDWAVGTTRRGICVLRHRLHKTRSWLRARAFPGHSAAASDYMGGDAAYRCIARTSTHAGPTFPLPRMPHPCCVLPSCARGRCAELRTRSCVTSLLAPRFCAVISAVAAAATDSSPLFLRDAIINQFMWRRGWLPSPIPRPHPSRRA